MESVKARNPKVKCCVFYTTLWACFALASQWFVSSPAHADDNPIFHTGTCTLKEGTETNDEQINAFFEECANLKAGGQLVFVSGTPEENFSVAYAKGSVGIHLTEMLSLFGQGHAEVLRPLGNDFQTVKDADSDLMMIRIGNPYLNGLSFGAGKFTAPFGVGLEQGSYSYRNFTDEFHYETYKYGYWVTWDNLQNLMFDLSYVGEGVPGTKAKIKDDGSKYFGDWGGSARISYDFSSLEGSRLVASAYGEHSGLRRSGLGFINVNSRGDMNSIEFVRTRLTPEGHTAPFRQLIRFGYLSSWRGGDRWEVAIEEDRKHQRLGEVSHHIQIKEYGEFNFGVLLRRTLEETYQDRWHLTSGLEVAF